ncbi:hypothetical protein [Paenibacillus tengchongensis]|uniref:hypothetical protein n=1 Tax=Paenibacillus tengchongensis TaxID=2608684 RepID=UPI00124D5137|nr:hypothetical protein [Paenibacillus tengchongensis]
MELRDIMVLLISGGFGGVLSGLYLNDGNWVSPAKIEIDTLHVKRNIYNLGIYSDILLGMGAGLIAALPLGLEYPKYIYVAMLGGFGGGSFIAKQAKMTLDAKLKTHEELPELSANSEIEVEITQENGSEAK